MAKNSMTMQEYGMSDEFKRKSFPMGKNEPFFYREGTQLIQNPKCETSGADFMKLYKEFVWKK